MAVLFRLLICKISEKIDMELLKRLALNGSLIARVAALTILDELTEGKLLKKLKEILKRN